jgi:Clostripain family
MSVRPWRILLYAMVGDEAERTLIVDAVREMQGELRTDECAIAVQINTASHMERHWISRRGNESQMLAVVKGSDKRELTRFIDEASARLEASSTALIIWAHGEGVDILREFVARHGGWPEDSSWLLSRTLSSETRARLESFALGKRLGPDWTTQEFLSNDDVRSAIAASRQKKVALLAFNACVMGMLEVAFEMRGVTDVLAFSQLFARTWPYGSIVRAFAQSPVVSASDLGKLIVRCVGEDLAAGTRDDAVSAVATGSLDALLNAMEPYALRVTSLVSSDWTAVRRAVMETVQRAHDPYQADVLSLLGVLGAGDLEASAAAQQVRTLLQRDVILANASPSSHPQLQGLSIFCPKRMKVDLDAAYRGFAFRKSKWTELLVTFQNALREEAQLGVRAALG